MMRANPAPLRISHVITSLGTGGAETMLLRLLRRLDPLKFQCEVIALTSQDLVGEQMVRAGISVRTLGLRPGAPNPWLIWRLSRWLKASAPDVVQTWLYHADLLGGVANRLGPKAPLIWSIRHDIPDPAYTSRSSRFSARMCALLSRRLPDRIIFNSITAKGLHRDYGYHAENALVIPNGYDLDVLRPDPQAYRAVREELGLDGSVKLIGLVARWNPQKDHRTFIQAAQMLGSSHPEVHFLLCGYDTTWENPTLRRWIGEAGLKARFHLLGVRKDIPRLNAAFDLSGISSLGEAFPNAVAEAMACGVPCVVTDVGDAAMIVGETGRVVPPAHPQALAAAWGEILAMTPSAREQLGRAARARVAAHFEIGQVVARFQALYEEVSGYVRN